jgi:hypothetical protein
MDGQVAKLTGLIALGRNDLALAEEAFRTAVRHNDKDSDARFYLGTALAAAKKWKDSAESCAVAEGGYLGDQRALRQRHVVSVARGRRKGTETGEETCLRLTVAGFRAACRWRVRSLP